MQQFYVTLLFEDFKTILFVSSQINYASFACVVYLVKKMLIKLTFFRPAIYFVVFYQWK